MTHNRLNQNLKFITMERPLFTQGIFLNLVSGNFKAMVRAFSVVLTITLIQNFGQAQVNCNTILACSDGVQISLDDDCNMTINPYMMMPQYTYHADSFDVEAVLPNGTPLTQFTTGFDTRNRPIRRVAINRSHIGMNLKVKVSLRGCGNSCWGHAAIEDKLAPVIGTCPCEERITGYSGSIPSGASIYNRPNVVGSGCSVGTFTNGVSYVTRSFAVDSNGVVDISLPQTNTWISLYQGTFTPGSPCTNLIATDDDNISITLMRNVTYTLVISTFNNTGVPPGGMVFNVFMESRKGSIKSSVDALVCESTCGSESTILAQTADNAPNRPVFYDGCSGAMWTPATFLRGTVRFENSNIILEGGSSTGGAMPPSLGAQICFTSPIAQRITFDWTTNIVPNVVSDEVFYTLNGTKTVLSTTLTSGTAVIVNIPQGGVFCFNVNTDNSVAYNILTLSNIVVAPVSGQVSPALSYTKTDSVTILPCSARFGKIIRRQWTATDPSGNKSLVKTQYFYIKRATIAEITCPTDWIRDCTVSYTKLPNGAPHPTMGPNPSGAPGGTGCENIQIFYDDIVFDLCGAGIKVNRRWTIIDWCTGRDTVCSQLIKIEDTQKPIITCPADIIKIPGSLENPADIISVSSDGCTASWDVKPPVSISDCSKVTYDVFIKLAGKDGGAPPASVPFVKVDGQTWVSGTSPAYASTIPQTDRSFRIEGLPLGRTWLKYVVTDECGNSTDCFTELDVVDRTPPTAICEDETVISIDDTGWGVLKAISLDDHSTDNCTHPDSLRFEVRRKNKFCPGYATDTMFRSEVRFCCSDVTAPESYHAVVLRVHDKAGNFNECETTIKVQNKRPVMIQCPTNKSLTCGDSRIGTWVSGTQAFDTTFFGKPTVTGVCADANVASRIISNTINSKCNTGTVSREWYLVSQPAVKCTQQLTIISPPFNSSSVTFPADITLSTCDLGKATPDFLNSKPIVSNLGCRDIGISFYDQVFRDVPGACIKVIRTWKVIDWCSYAANPVVVEQSQKILLTGTGPVTFTGCNNRTITASPGKCDTTVTLSVNPMDDCTDEEEWKYSWTLNLDSDKGSSIDDNGTTNSTTQNLPAGTHRISFTVTNVCGTQSICAYNITVIANKAPTPVCYGEIVWVMDRSGTTDVWANDFIQSTSTNICGRAAQFDYYIFKRDNNNIVFNTPTTGITLTCADIPNGQVARIPLKVYVRDRNSGLSDFCNVTLILQDSPLTNACTDRPNLLPVISGRISTDRNEGVEEIEVSLKNMTSSAEIKSMTKQNGEYKLEGVDVFDPKSMGAYKNNDILNGVSTLDLVMIQRHILGIQKIDSPYKLLAADVNNSRNITASDLVSLRKLVLGVTNEFDNNTSWRFVPSSYVFSDVNNPFDYPFKVNFDSLYEDKKNVNFTAVKVGDVNGSVVVNAKSTEFRSGNTLFTSDEMKFSAGEIVKFEVRAGDDMYILGTQFGIDFNADQLLFTGLTSGAFDIKSQHYNPFNAPNGKLNFSYDIANGKLLKSDEVLFTIEFKALAGGNTKNIRLDQSVIRPEVYDVDGSVRNLLIQTRDRNISHSQNSLYQNEPNPFKESTVISFELAKPEFVKLRILDLTGKLIYTSNGNYEKGFNSINVNNTQIGTSGVYYYQIEAGEFTATKKMILIE
jgi:hypothetical protein